MSEETVVSKFNNKNYISNFLKLLTLTSPNRVLPVKEELYEMECKLNKNQTEFTDNEDCSTVALSSNPSSFSSNESAEEYYSNKEYSFEPNKFKYISVLGSGSFGTVLLAQYESREYAIKKLPKNRITTEEFEQIMVEKKILMEMDNPFVLGLCGTFQTNNELCFVTEALEHGELWHAIHDGNKLTHEECVFYGACIVLGLDFIHSKNIVYRDLKPENIMIASNGCPKIIDFGLAKQLPYLKRGDDGFIRSYTKCYTLCGTPEYVAPEIILRNGYDGAIDVWALGVMLYEMIFRRTPFVDGKNEKDITVILTNIVLCGKNGIAISKKIDQRTDGTPNARNLITQLLNGDKIERLGKNNTINSLLNHPYFLSTNINFDDLYNQTIPAPIIQPLLIGRDIETLKDVEEYTGDQDIFKDF